MNKNISSILIANRGEIASRIIRTCQKMGIKSIAVFSEADRDSMFVSEATTAVFIGESSPNKSYLDIDKIIAVAKKTGANAIHPGYGFLSENAKFSKICEEHGIKFIGASAEMIDKMGDKASAKETMLKAKVPCVPGSAGILKDFADCKKTAKAVGYPVMLKATAGGGGKGMRWVWEESKLEEAWKSARTESKAAFGNDGMYMEKFVEEPRHIEIQIASDQHGNHCHMSERDCSIQRRHQKLLEEAPSPFVTDKLRKEMGDASVKAGESINYEGVGTVEFLVDKHKNFYFMEMNTRIQVEHPVTEEVINFDLIKEQINLAAGIPISGKNHLPKGHAIECRINAEDVYKDFRPSPGKITELHKPGGHGVRVDSHIYVGYSIPANYDSMIAKLIVWAQTREEAIKKMERSLQEFVIEGIKTTIPLQLQIMQNEDFKAGNFDTSFMNSFEIK